MRNFKSIHTLDIQKQALEAEKRIRKYIRKTPLEYSPFLSKESQAQVYLKLENFQLTHSFKIRGAFNKLLSLSVEETKEKRLYLFSVGLG